MMELSETGLFIEDGHSREQAYTLRFRVNRWVAEQQSPYQKIVVADLPVFGRALFLDDFGQSAEADEAIYHESLILPAVVAQGAPQTAFVAGGGEGAPLRELLRSPTIQSIRMVDIDAVMCALAKEYLGSWHKGAFDDPRVTLVHEDARKVLEQEQSRYDLIVLDLSDPEVGGPSARLFTAEFYSLCRDRLNSGGVMVVQADAANYLEHEAFVSIVKTLRTLFKYCLPYTADVPFFGGSWGFVLVGDDDRLAQFTCADVDEAVALLGGDELKFYDTESHRHLFALPRYLRTALNNPQAGKIIRDTDLLVLS